MPKAKTTKSTAAKAPKTTRSSSKTKATKVKSLKRPKSTQQKISVKRKGKIAASTKALNKIKTIHLDVKKLPEIINRHFQLVSFGLLLVLIFCAVAASSVNITKLLPASEIKCDAYEPLSRDCLRRAARDADIGLSTLNTCLDESKYNDQITANLDKAQELGIQATPHVMIGILQDDKSIKGFYIGGDQDADQFKDIIQKVIDNGLETSHDNFVSENLGTVDELAQKYVDYYGASVTDVDDATLQEYAKQAAEDTFAAYEIKDFDLQNGIVEGDESSDIILMVYSDFNCSSCQVFFNDTLPVIKSDLIDKGKVRFVYKPIAAEDTPAQGYRAANALFCAAGKGKFWQYMDSIYQVNE